MNKIPTYLILLVLSFAIYGTYGLVVEEFVQKDVCPKILGIPACYIVITCFATALVAHIASLLGGFVNKLNWIYFFFVGIVTLIATTGTLGEILGFAKCPRTSGGIPMCFISLAICTSLLVAKWWETK